MGLHSFPINTRDRFGLLIVKVSLYLAGLAVSTALIAAERQTIDRLVAVVGNEIILKSELDEAMTPLIAKMRGD